MREYKVGLVLTADGKILKAEVKGAKDALSDLGDEAKRAEVPVRDTGDALNQTGQEAKGAEKPLRDTGLPRGIDARGHGHQGAPA